jgi:fumarate hydratase subunit beta
VKQISLQLPISLDQINKVHAGDKILISGCIYTARDQAHKRLIAMILNNEELPFKLKDSGIFYCGPSPAASGQICGAVGPTTSYRMDRYLEPLLSQGLRIMIGKGDRSEQANQLIRRYGALYLCAVGGISAVLNQHIVSCETFLWPELGAEAIFRMEVKDFPCYVCICGTY